MTKYTQEVKDKCVEAAKNGTHLKTIQLQLGPNPKATIRYLKKVGIDYKELLVELKNSGKVPKTPLATSKDKTAKNKKGNKPTTKVIEE